MMEPDLIIRGRHITDKELHQVRSVIAEQQAGARPCSHFQETVSTVWGIGDRKTAITRGQTGTVALAAKWQPDQQISDTW